MYRKVLKYGENFLPFQLNGQLNESSKEQHFHLPENYQINIKTSSNSHTYSLYSLNLKLQPFFIDGTVKKTLWPFTKTSSKSFNTNNSISIIWTYALLHLFHLKGYMYTSLDFRHIPHMDISKTKGGYVAYSWLVIPFLLIIPKPRITKTRGISQKHKPKDCFTPY